MSRFPGCRSEQEDLRRRALLGCRFEFAANRRQAKVAGRGDLDPGGEGQCTHVGWCSAAAAHAALHAAIDAGLVPPRRKLALLHDSDRAPDGVLADLLPRVHAGVRHGLLLRPGQPDDGAPKLLQRSGPCHGMASVVSIQVAGQGSAVARMVRADLQRAGGCR